MPKVYLPLGSASASGQMGEMMVYQGNTVRVYTVPVDPRTNAQIDVRNLFHDVTKILKTLGLFGRGKLSGMVGPRWYTLAYAAITGNGAQLLNEQLAIWDTLTDVERDAWRDVAPYVATYADPGKMFFAVGGALQEWGYAYMVNMLLATYPQNNNAVAYRAAWDMDLSNVITLSKTDDKDARIYRTGAWTYITDPLCFGGGYYQTGVWTAGIGMTFLGNRFSLGYVGIPTGGTLILNFYEYGKVLVDQYRSQITRDLVVTKDFPHYGIHGVYMNLSYSTTQAVTFDFVDCDKVKTVNLPTVDSAPSAVGLVAQVEIDFGSMPTYGGVFVVTISGMIAGKKIMVTQAADAVNGRAQDENEVDALILRGVAGDGVATIYANSLLGPVSGKYKINVLFG